MIRLHLTTAALLAAIAHGAPAAAQEQCSTTPRVGVSGTQEISDSTLRELLLEMKLVDPAAEMVTLTREQGPELRNQATVSEVMGREARLVRGEAPKQMTALLMFEVQADGTPGGVYLARSSGVDAMDEGARRVVQAMRFRPARIDRCPLPSWAFVPITFQPG